jgi:hypothetical protein
VKQIALARTEGQAGNRGIEELTTSQTPLDSLAISMLKMVQKDAGGTRDDNAHTDAPARESIETRTLVFFAPEATTQR